MAALSLSGALFCGCTVEFPEGVIGCQEDSECPEGWNCRANRCYSGSADGEPDSGLPPTLPDAQRMSDAAVGAMGSGMDARTASDVGPDGAGPDAAGADAGDACVPLANACERGCGTADNGCGVELDCGDPCQEPCTGCSIDGECIADGVAKSDDVCLICDADRATDRWSHSDGQSCDDGVGCTAGDRCTAGICQGTDDCPGDSLCNAGSDSCMSTCDGCVIGGACYAAQAQNSTNPCLICDPSASASQWTINTGANCGNGPTECSYQDTCSPTGVCVPNHVGSGERCGAAATECSDADTCDGAGGCQPNDKAATVECGGAPTHCQRQDYCDGAGACADSGTSPACSNPTCATYCSTLEANCAGTNVRQYLAENICLAACATFPAGSSGQSSGDSLACRIGYAELAASNPATNCPIAGPGGNGVCGANCTGYCDMMMAACPGTFASRTACDQRCATFVGTSTYTVWYRPFESVSCALYGASRATIDDDPYCAQASEARCP